MEYLFTFAITLLAIKFAESFFNKKKRGPALFWLFISIIVPSVLAGCRDTSVGLDVEYYVVPLFKLASYYRSVADYIADVNIEYLYGALNLGVAHYTKEITWLLFTIQLIEITLVVLSLYRFRKKVPMWLGMALYLFVFYNISFNMVRQSIAMCFCLYSFSLLISGRIKLSFLPALIAVGFHSTGFIYLGVYVMYFLFDRIKDKYKWMELICASTLGMVIYQLDYLLFQFMKIGLLGNKFEMYTSVNGTWGTNMPLSDFGFTVFLLSLIFMVRKYKKSIDNYRFYRVISLFSVFLCLTGLISTYAVRGMYYFSFLFVLIIPLVLNKDVIKFSDCKTLPRLSLLFLILYWCLAYAYANLGNTFPYSSKFLF